MKKSTGIMDKNGIEVFEGDRLYCHTNGCYCRIVKSKVSDELYVKFKNGTVSWSPRLLEIWDMEVI